MYPHITITRTDNGHGLHPSRRYEVDVDDVSFVVVAGAVAALQKKWDSYDNIDGGAQL